MREAKDFQNKKNKKKAKNKYVGGERERSHVHDLHDRVPSLIEYWRTLSDTIFAISNDYYLFAFFFKENSSIISIFCGNHSSSCAEDDVPLLLSMLWLWLLRLRWALQLLLHVVMSSQFRSHFFRHVKGRPQVTQILFGKFSFNTTFPLVDDDDDEGFLMNNLVAWDGNAVWCWCWC